MPRKQGCLARKAQALQFPPCLQTAVAAGVLRASSVTFEERAGYAASANWHGAAEVSPCLDLAGKGGLTLSSGDGKHLYRVQFQCMGLWVWPEILLVFSRLAEYIGFMDEGISKSFCNFFSC